MIHEPILRPLLFISILLIMVALEYCFPARKLITKPQSPSNKMRLMGNFGLILLSGLIARFIFPLGLVAFAVYCDDQQWGLFNLLNISALLPSWLMIVFSLLLLDIMIYWQHRLFHKIPLLWRLHKVHHADPHVDASTGLRFHPLEIIASIIIKMILVFLLGVPVIAVILFEILLNGFALFNHANIRLPKKIEALTRTILVTQILHRIHHSQRLDESNCNFGFSVIWWDKIFGSYADKATQTDAEIVIGLSEYPDVQQNAHLWGLLSMPFKRK